MSETTAKIHDPATCRNGDHYGQCPGVTLPLAAERTPADGPCQCHQSFASVTPTHRGHCCFVPATQACHPAEVAEWERQHALRHPHAYLTTPDTED